MFIALRNFVRRLTTRDHRGIEWRLVSYAHDDLVSLVSDPDGGEVYTAVGVCNRGVVWLTTSDDTNDMDYTYSPEEARNLAHALVLSAERAEERRRDRAEDANGENEAKAGGQRIMQTWKDFKTAVEAAGVRDEDEVEDITCDHAPIVVFVPQPDRKPDEPRVFHVI